MGLASKGYSVYPNWSRPFGLGVSLSKRVRKTNVYRGVFRPYGFALRVAGGWQEVGMMLGRYALTLAYISMVCTVMLLLQIWQWSHA